MMSFSKAYRLILLILLVCFGVFAGKAGVISYMTDPYEYPIIARLFWQHLCLVSVSMTMATLIGLGAVIIATRNRFEKVSGLILYIIGLGQTIPSLAVLAISMSFLGIGFIPAVFAMTLPQLRSSKPPLTFHRHPRQHHQPRVRTSHRPTDQAEQP